MGDPRFVFRVAEATVGNADAVIDDRDDDRIEWTTFWGIAFSLGFGRSVLVDSRLSGAQTKFLGLVVGGRDYRNVFDRETGVGNLDVEIGILGQLLQLNERVPRHKDVGADARSGGVRIERETQRGVAGPSHPGTNPDQSFESPFAFPLRREGIAKLRGPLVRQPQREPQGSPAMVDFFGQLVQPVGFRADPVRSVREVIADPGIAHVISPPPATLWRLPSITSKAGCDRG